MADLKDPRTLPAFPRLVTSRKYYCIETKTPILGNTWYYEDQSCVGNSIPFVRSTWSTYLFRKQESLCDIGCYIVIII